MRAEERRSVTVEVVEAGADVGVRPGDERHSPGRARGPHVTRRVTGAVDALAPALLYLAGQAVTAGVVGALALRYRRLTGWAWVDVWDANNFLRVARLGYAGVMAKGRSPLAFFPAYPAAIAAVHALTALPAVAAGVLVSLAAGVALAYGVRALGATLAVPRGQQLALVAMVAVGPLSVVFEMVYSEALFCASAVWALVLLLRRSWLMAGLLCVVSGLVGPTSAALTAAFAAAVVTAGGAAGRRRLCWRAWAGLALAPAGLVAYLGWVGWRTGSPLGWFAVERAGWNTHFDFGVFTVRSSLHVLQQPYPVHGVATVVVGAAGLALLARAVAPVVRGRPPALPWPLVAYSACVLVEALASAGLWGSKLRLMMPAVPLLLLLLPQAAAVTGRARVLVQRPVQVAALTCWGALGVSYSAYILIVYGLSL